MKITDFSELWRAANKIKIDIIVKTEIKSFENEGLDTDLSDVYASSEGELYTILRDGSIRKTIVHICDISTYRKDWDLPRFHVFDCKTLTRMRDNNREYRYKKASRGDGQFWIIRGQDKSYATLSICNLDCLGRYNAIYDYQTVQGFDVGVYLQKPLQHTQAYITQEQDMTTIPASYASNWNEISEQRKKYHKWICQECFYNLDNCKQYLHTHHVNADITNNVYENLKVLCINCHANEFNHGHIKKTLEYNEFLESQ